MAGPTESHVSANTSNSDLSKPDPLPVGEEKPTTIDAEKNGLSKQATPLEADTEKGENGETLEQELSRIGTADYPKRVPLLLIVVALMLSIFLVALDMTIVATAIPKITDDFESLDQVGWYGSAFFLTLAAFQSTWGKTYKYFPLKLTFLSAIALFEVGSLICAVANNSTTLIVGRAIAGWGGAGIASGVYTIIAFSAPPHLRPAFTGILGASFGIASVLGPLLGGVFTENLTWRWCFWINLPIGGVSTAVIMVFFKTPKAAKPVPATWREKILQMDFPGTAVILCGIVCLLLAMEWAGVTRSWSDGSVIACLVMFPILLILFIGIEYYSGDRALLQGRLLKDRTLSGMCAAVFFICGPFFIILYYIPIYFQATKDVSAQQSGINNLPFVIGASLFTIVSGGLITVYGHFIPLMFVGSTFSAIGAGLIYTLDVNSPSKEWIGYQALSGIGLGLAFQIPVIVGQALVKPSDLSTISAMILFFQSMAGTVWIGAAQSGFSNTLLKKITEHAPNVNPAEVLHAGATGLADVFSGDDLAGIRDAYVDGLRIAYIIAIAVSCGGFFVTFWPKWQSIKGKVNM